MRFLSVFPLRRDSLFKDHPPMWVFLPKTMHPAQAGHRSTIVFPGQLIVENPIHHPS
jgi:hypothetical protein